MLQVHQTRREQFNFNDCTYLFLCCITTGTAKVYVSSQTSCIYARFFANRLHFPKEAVCDRSIG